MGRSSPTRRGWRAEGPRSHCLRVRGDGGWYDKVVVDVAWQIDEAGAPLLFMESVPTAVLDELVSLH